MKNKHKEFLIHVSANLTYLQYLQSRNSTDVNFHIKLLIEFVDDYIDAMDAKNDSEDEEFLNKESTESVENCVFEKYCETTNKQIQEINKTIKNFSYLVTTINNKYESTQQQLEAVIYHVDEKNNDLDNKLNSIKNESTINCDKKIISDQSQNDLKNIFVKIFDLEEKIKKLDESLGVLHKSTSDQNDDIRQKIALIKSERLSFNRSPY